MLDENYLNKIYYDPSHPASFSGAEKLFRFLRKKGNSDITRDQIKHWLDKQENNTLFTPVRRKFKRRKIITSGVDTEWAVDVAYVDNISEYNQNVKYLLFCIDVFSKYLFIEPLKGKSGADVVKALQSVFEKGRIPVSIHVDKGKEFHNRSVGKLLKNQDIKLFSTENDDIKSSICERVIRTIKNKLYKLFQSRQSYVYIDVLQDIVKSYNHTPHRGIGYKLPSEVTKENEELIWLRQMRSQNLNYPPSNFKFKIGQLVRLAYKRYKFNRDYHEKWTTELFKITHRIFKQNLPVYKVADLMLEPVVGWYQEDELRLVQSNDIIYWNISKILRKRKRKGRIQYLVSWQGYPSKFNSYVDEADIKNLTYKQNI